MLIDAMNKGLKPGVDCCITCGSTEELQTLGADLYCEKHAEEVKESFSREKPKKEEALLSAAEALKQKRIFHILERTKSVAELFKDGVPPINWLVDYFVPERGILMIGAEPKSYKTFMALHLAMSVADGLPFLGEYPTKQARVLYIDEENGQATVGRRVHMLKDGYDLQELPEKLYLTSFEGIKLDTQEGAEIVEELIHEFTPRLVVIDSMVRFLDGQEDKAHDVREIFENLKPIMELTNVAFVILHHTRKDNNKGMAGLRGSGDFAAFVDAVVMLSASKRGEIKVSMEANRHIEPILPVKILVEHPHEDDEGEIYFRHLGATESETQTAVVACRQDLAKWAEDGEVVQFGTKQAIDAMKARGGHSQRSTYRALAELNEDGEIRKLAKGKYETVKGRLFPIKEVL